jgi:aldehyde dehydrogenase (NAD+)
MSNMEIPEKITNWIDGEQRSAQDGEWLPKYSPATGQEIYQLARSGSEDIDSAVKVAVEAQPAWADTPAVQRGLVLHEIVKGLQNHREEMAQVVALETGKALKEALGETEGAIQQGLFMAGEGQRLYGRTTTSGVANKYAMTVRQPVGVAGLIIAANTPIANVAWKVFPALICGNAVILKAAEDTPATAWLFGAIAKEAGLPDGVLNIIQGSGLEAGAPLVEHDKVDVVSFTGSTRVGREIAAKVGQRLGRVSLELGGKNPLVVCEDADLQNAARWVCLSAFSNAGQRCASGSRIIIFDAVYDQFRDMLVEYAAALKVGSGDEHDLGPVINERQLSCMLAAVEEAKSKGARVLIGGERLSGEEHQGGYYLAPTLVEAVAPEDAMSTTELFGPITTLYRVKDFNEALDLANNSPYGLTACIHTRDFNRAMEFSYRVQAGATVVNAGTYGSEPHMPFGGFKQSGNGTREPGTEALDVYSELKDIYLIVEPAQV